MTLPTRSRRGVLSCPTGPAWPAEAVDVGEPETEQSEATRTGQGSDGQNLLLTPERANDVEDISPEQGATRP